MTNRGCFIVLEGAEGSGKSTQARLVAQELEELGDDVVLTHEPGDTKVGQAIRKIVLGTSPEEGLTLKAELFLMLADRAAHVENVIEPALEEGKTVITDRFAPSTLVYQGLVQGLEVEEIKQMSHWASGGLQPDQVIVLDIDSDTASERISFSADQMEQRGPEFHERVRQGYRRLAEQAGWILLDGTRSETELTKAILAILQEGR